MQKRKNKRHIVQRIVLVWRWCFYYLIALPILFILNCLVFGMKIRGRKNLRKVKGAVVVCNHVHYLDCAMAACAMVPKKMIFTSQKSNFEMPIVGWLLRQFEVEPIGDTAAEVKNFVKRSKAKLNSGGWICVYPEGALELYCEKLRAFRDGAFYLAAETKKPIVPVVICRRERKGIWKIIKRRPTFTVKILNPIYPNKNMKKRKSAEILQSEVFNLMKNEL